MCACRRQPASQTHVVRLFRGSVTAVGWQHSSKLTVVAYGLKGADAAQFVEIAKEAEGRCPVSNAYRGTMQITLDAKVG